jgi:putative ABC transport system permease protein
MIKHYLKVAFRNLSKQKGLTFINILGLSTGLACFTLFLLYAVNEFNYDRFHQKADNIYRVYRWSAPMSGFSGGGDVHLPMPVGPALKEDIPDVENFVRLRDPWGVNFVKINNEVSGHEISFADPQFFTVFSFKLKSGDPATALKGLKNVVLSSEKAKQLFGKENPVGRVIEIKLDEGYEPFVITGVAEKIPSNSSISFDILANFEYIGTTPNGKRSVGNWNRSAYYTYVQLEPGSKLASQPERLLSFRRKYYPNEESELRKAGHWAGDGSPFTYGMQSLKSMHNDTEIWGGTIPSVAPKTIWILLGIATAVLLIACINFTTLSIGRSAGRAREIGIRKVVGSRRKQLVFQFLAEAVLLTIISVMLGLVLSYLLLPWFNQLSAKELTISFTQFPELYWFLGGLTIVVGLLAGSYPALVLSGFRPLEVLKQKIKVGGANVFTKSLVTLQFVLSIGLIASTIIILQQIGFMKGRHPGFNKENIIVVNASETDGKKLYPLFKQAVQSQPGIDGVASSELSLGAGTGWSSSGFEYKGKNKQVIEYFIDPNYIPLMGIQLLTGRNFDPAISIDTVTSIIVNEAMVKEFGWTLENAVGQTLPGYMDTKTPVVIGVVKNFHYGPFRDEVKPQMFHMYADYTPYKFFVRIKPGDPSVAIASLGAAWQKINAGTPFRYDFLDENLAKFYRSEERWGNILGWAGGISVFLACLGLFGLAALAAVNRTKEIGIRKVLGASLPAIVSLLSKDFIKLICIALMIAAPLAWFFMNKWLQDFAYRISIGWWIFLLAGATGILIAFITISVQAIKVAIANPVKSLRTE